MGGAGIDREESSQNAKSNPSRIIIVLYLRVMFDVFNDEYEITIAVNSQ